MIDHTSAWQKWEDLFYRRNQNPVDVMKEYLRTEGWIVERPETLSMPVKVVRTGSYTHEDGYRITLHVRANIGDRMAQVDYSIDMRHADMPVRAFTDAIGNKFSRMIENEISPQIEAGCELELRKAFEDAK